MQREMKGAPCRVYLNQIAKSRNLILLLILIIPLMRPPPPPPELLLLKFGALA